jgi:hypothetical protein
MDIPWSVHIPKKLESGGALPLYVMDPVVSIKPPFLLGRKESGEVRSMEMYASNLEYISVCIWLWA